MTTYKLNLSHTYKNKPITIKQVRKALKDNTFKFIKETKEENKDEECLRILQFNNYLRITEGL